MLTLNIDGKERKAKEGQTILEVARENGIDISTLCYHENLAPYGACRLCLVEIFKNGRSRLVTSCLYPVEEGLEVKTGSPRAMSNRKMINVVVIGGGNSAMDCARVAKRMGADVRTLATSREGVFAGGDAVAAGQRAASSIKRYLKGEPLDPIPGRKDPERYQPPFALEEEPQEKPRAKVKESDAKTRTTDFRETMFNYSKEEALEEVGRCLRCDTELS